MRTDAKEIHQQERKIENLEKYQEALRNELKGVEEALKALNREE